MKRLLITGGGTGGHVAAGIAVSEAWKKLHGPTAQVLFVGAEGGLEEKMVPKAGIPLKTLRLGALNRVSRITKLKTLAKIPIAFLKSLAILISYRPDAVLGVGGYASGPVILMASFLRFIFRMKTAILEQNSVAGLTNRLLSRRVDLIFTAFPGTDSAFGRKTTLFTGNPTRSSIRSLPSASRSPFVIFVFGGSQGAIGLNTLVIETLALLKDCQDNIQWIHQTGQKDFERVSEAHQKAGFSNSKVSIFIDQMMDAYSGASLLITRAGASTLSEIACVGRAVVLVPLPTSADDHQRKNARLFESAGAAWIVEQDQAQAPRLAELIRGLIQTPEQLTVIEEKSRNLYRPNAAETIAQALDSPK